MAFQIIWFIIFITSKIHLLNQWIKHSTQTIRPTWKLMSFYKMWYIFLNMVNMIHCDEYWCHFTWCNTILSIWSIWHLWWNKITFCFLWKFIACNDVFIDSNFFILSQLHLHGNLIPLHMVWYIILIMVIEIYKWNHISLKLI